MNRQQRRQAARQQRDAEQALRLADACPDCNAETRLAQQAPGVFVLKVAHDNTCPTYRAMKKENKS